MKPFDLHGLKTYDLRSRPSKVFVEDLGRPLAAEPSVGDWLDSLPRQFAANESRRVRDHLCRACARATDRRGGPGRPRHQDRLRPT